MKRDTASGTLYPITTKSMWNKPWKYREGSMIVAVLFVAGTILQLTVGFINWDIIAWPVNIIIMMIFIGAIVIGHQLRTRFYILQFVSTRYAAVPVLIASAVATAVFGVTNIHATLSFWPFVLLYMWMDIIVGFVTLKHLKPSLYNFCLTTSHAGLFIALTAGTLGNADIQHLRMQISSNHPEWFAVDDENMVRELPFSVSLNHFTIDEYPPKLIIIDNETGDALPIGRPQSLVLEDSTVTGSILDYNIETKRLYHYATMETSGDTINYVERKNDGATTAAFVKVTTKENKHLASEWVANKSYLFPPKSIRLNEKHSLIMPECEPKRYASDITISKKNGKKEHAIIEVNKPYDIEGWKIYQLSYDKAMGRWSKTSVIELVYDSWLPIVYIGIALLIIGAITLFLTAGRKEDAK